MNEDKCRCECRQLTDKGMGDKGFNWDPINCEWECTKSCDVGEYLGYNYFKRRKRLVDKLVEECNENIDEEELHPNKMIYNSILHDYEKISSSCEDSSCTVCYIFHNSYKHYQCFYLFWMVFKKKIYWNNNLLNATLFNI